MKSQFKSIAIASDHAGVQLKQVLVDFLEAEGLVVKDLGPSTTESVDYADYAFAAASMVGGNDCDAGIVICGTGLGVSITANKVKGIRAALCHCTEYARLAREHNNANVLAMGARFVAVELAKDITRVFMETPFAGGRHERRVSKIHDKTGC